MQPFRRYYTLSVPAGLFWKLYLPLLLLISVAAAAAGFFIIDLFIMPKIVGIQRDVVQVPAVQGLPLEEAREKFYAVGLLTEIQGRDYDNAVPEESVIAQVPEPGAKVKKGRRIAVVVSKGKEYSVVPDVKDMTERQVRIELKKGGFQVGEVTKKYHDKQPAETVVELFPKSGSRPTSTEMPNIVGENIAGARKILESCGLRVGRTTYRNDHSLLPGTVISQSVPPGKDVPFEAPVDMTISVVQ